MKKPNLFAPFPGVLINNISFCIEKYLIEAMDLYISSALFICL